MSWKQKPAAGWVQCSRQVQLTPLAELVSSIMEPELVAKFVSSCEQNAPWIHFIPKHMTVLKTRERKVCEWNPLLVEETIPPKIPLHDP